MRTRLRWLLALALTTWTIGLTSLVLVVHHVLTSC